MAEKTYTVVLDEQEFRALANVAASALKDPNTPPVQAKVCQELVTIATKELR